MCTANALIGSVAAAMQRSDLPVAWLLTFSTHLRKPALDDPDLLAACAGGLKEAAVRNGYPVHALAIMPDHVHMVVGAGLAAHSISKMVNNLKGVASRRVFQISPELKMDLGSAHLWTNGYDVRHLFGPRALHAACLYVKQNPVKLGLPEQHYDWLEAKSR